MNPYSLPSIGTTNSMDASTVNGMSSTLSWLTQPYQFNSSGNLPGTTTIGINGNGVQISGPTSSIILSDPTSQQTAISLLGNKGYMLVTDPTTQINQIIIGKLPDGTYGIVVSKPGIDVLTVFT